MERHNRKSYLGPAPPKSLKDKEKEKERKKEKLEEREKQKENESSVRPTPPPKPASRPSRTPHYTPTSEEIPLNIASDAPAHPRHHNAPPPPSNASAAYPPRPTRSPLDHLSLETKDDDYRPRRPSYTAHGTPTSALDVPARPNLGMRSASSSNMKSRTALNNTALPIRAAPPPNGSSGTPTSSSGGSSSSWRRQVRDHMTGAAYGN